MDIPTEYKERFYKNLAELKEGCAGIHIFEEPLFASGAHPENFVDYECGFAAYHIGQANPRTILDVGSYRHFILGLLAHYSVTTTDVRPRNPVTIPETIITCDAKKLDLPDGSFDLVLSLCALEHFGLGRYGDEFDFQADRKAFAEMVRVLKPGGRLVFTTTITRAQPAIAFNAHRIYNHDMLQAFCSGLVLVQEKFYSHKMKGPCSLTDITSDPKWWDVYLGCWKKIEGGEGDFF